MSGPAISIAGPDCLVYTISSVAREQELLSDWCGEEGGNLPGSIG